MTPFRDQVIALRQCGVECRAIYDILREEHAFSGGDESVYRFVRHLEARTPEAHVRVETGPAEDYGESRVMVRGESGRRIFA